MTNSNAGGIVSIIGPITVLNVLYHIAYHDLLHTAQITTAIGLSPGAVAAGDGAGDGIRTRGHLLGRQELCP